MFKQSLGHFLEVLRRGAEMEPATAAECSRLIILNYWPGVLVTHPTAPWLPAFLGGIGFDPNEYPQFGFVRFKCHNVQNVNDCKYVHR